MGLFTKMIFFVGLIASGMVRAEINERTIKIVGRKDAVVTTSQVSLGDIADVSSRRLIDDEAVIGLKKIPLEKSPGPGDTLTISASNVLEKLRNSGVDLDNVGYTFPRIIVVKRAAREITVQEVKEAIDEFIKTSGKDIALKGVSLQQPVFVLPGETKLAIQPAQAINGIQRTFGVIAKVDNALPVRFEALATVDEWREIPVAKRSIARGEVLSDDDLMMARLNLSTIPKDAALDPEKIVGLRVNADLNYGESFRRQKLAVPAVIEAGARITMSYRSPLFEALAKGTALDAGAVGQEIRVRNESSKKVVVGRVTEAGMVEVTP